MLGGCEVLGGCVRWMCEVLGGCVICWFVSVGWMCEMLDECVRCWVDVSVG